MYTMDAGYTRTALLFSTVSGNGPVVLPDIVDKVKCLNGYEIFFFHLWVTLGHPFGGCDAAVYINFLIKSIRVSIHSVYLLYMYV